MNVKTKELSKREKEVYNYILEFKKANQYSPSWNEIASEICTSKSYVAKLLDNLEDKGYIKQHKGKYRSITCLVFTT